MLRVGMKGIDISVHQGTPDFEAAKSSGLVDFVIAKAYEYHQDIQFRHTWAELERLGIKRGVYQYIAFENSPYSDADKLRAIVTACGGIKPNDFIMVDAESSQDTGPLEFYFHNGAIGYAMIERLEYIEQLFPGNPIIVYSGYYFLRDHHYFEYEDLKKYPLVLAEYDGNHTLSLVPAGFKVIMHQYSSTGSVPGFGGNVDMDVVLEDFGMDLEKIQKATDGQWEVKEFLEFQLEMRKGKLAELKKANGVLGGGLVDAQIQEAINIADAEVEKYTALVKKQFDGIVAIKQEVGLQ